MSAKLSKALKEPEITQAPTRFMLACQIGGIPGAIGAAQACAKKIR